MHRITIVIATALALASASVGAEAQVEAATGRNHSVAWERMPATVTKGISARSVLQKRAYLEVELVLLREALAELSARAEVSLVYSPSLLPDAPVSCDCRSATVGEALRRLLSHTGFAFMEDQSQILIEPRASAALDPTRISPGVLSRTPPHLAARPFSQETSQMKRKVMSYGRGIVVAGALAAAAPGGLSAQEHQVSGRVVSSELAPMAGVSVVVQGTTVGTLTNSSGGYSIIAPSGTGTLVFSMLGTRTREEPIAGRSIINITMETEAIGLDEVVVVGYGQQTRATVSGSVSSVSNEDIDRSSANTVSEMLVGKVAGINTRMTTATGTSQFRGRVPEDGRPGAGAALQIRNLGDPLFVIDGVPATSLEFNQINAADIDNISILKDASASVYGFRAANGVVLVTTKRGSGLRTPQLRVTADYGVQNLQRNRSKLGWGDTAYQFLFSNVEWQQNTGRPRGMTAEELERWRVGGPGYESHPSWPEFIRSNAPQANINANVSGGGNNNASYYLGLGYTTQDYAQLDNNFSRGNVQANVSTEVFDGFSVGTELRARREDHTNVANTNSSSVNNIGDPQLVYWQAHDSMWPHQDNWANGNRDFINGDVRYFVRSPGSFRRAVGGTQDQIRTNLTGNFWAEYQLPIGPVVRATYSQTKDLEEFDVHRYSFNGYCYDEATDTYNVCDTYSGQSRRSIRAVGDRDYLELRLSHALNFGSHSLSFVTGAEASGGDMTTNHIYSIPSSNFNSLIDFAEVLDARTEWEIERRASYIGRLNYDYQQKYLAELVGRYDGSYLYAPGKRWGLFPGVSVGWRVTEEPFFANAVPFLDELKLRASWGQAGREQGISDWGYLGGATLGQGLPAVLSGTVVPAIQPRGLPVTNLSWVTSTTRNVGVDFALLNRRLAGEVDLFERKLSGLPASRYDVALPSELGYSLPNENLESEATIGFDGILRYSDRVGAVAFSFAPNFTLARRKVLDRYKPRYGNSWVEYRQGQEDRWANTNFTYRWTGEVFQSMEEIARHPVDIDGQGNRTLLPGDMIFEDTNGDGKINDLDLRVRVFPAGETPILNFGLSGSLSYAGATLSYDFGGGGLYGFNAVMAPYGTQHNGGTYTSSRWRRADLFDDNSEWIPGKFPPLRKESHSSYRQSTRNYVNARYFRLRHVELGYEVPIGLASRVGLARLRVFGNGANAFLLDNIQQWSVDPEIAYTNALNYPYPVTWTAGFNASVGGSPTQMAPVPVPPVLED